MSRISPGLGSARTHGSGFGLARESPGVGRVGGNEGDGFGFLDLEKVLVQPFAGLGIETVQGIGDGKKVLRIAFEHDVASIGKALVAEAHHGRGPFGFLRVFFAQEERLQRLALGILELDQHAGVGPPARLRQVHAGQLRGGDRFGLDNFQVADFEEQFADLGKIGWIIALFQHAPVVSFSAEGQFAFALEVNGGDVIDLEIVQELLSGLADGGGPGLLVVPEQHQTGPADEGQGDQEQEQLFAIHFAAVRLRLTMARTMPVTATRAGMEPMLTTLVQNSSASVSWRNFLRDGFEVLVHVGHRFLIVLQFFLLFGREDELLLVAGFAGLQFTDFAFGFGLRSLQRLEFVLPFFAGFGLHVLQAGEGAVEAGPAAQADEIIVPGQLLDEALHQVQIAVHGPHQPIAQEILHLHANLVTEQVAVAHQNDDAVRLGFLQLRFVGLVVGFVLFVLGGLGRAVGEGGFEFASQSHRQSVVDVGRLEVLDDLLGGDGGR